MSEYSVLAIDIGGTFVRIGLVDELGQLKKMKKYSTELLKNQGDSAETLLQDIRVYLKETGACPDMISVGIPGSVSPDGRTVLQCPMIYNETGGLDQHPVAEFLEKHLHIPTILNRDANNILLYYMSQYTVPEEGMVLGFFYGTGIGNSLYYRGRFINGKNGYGGWVGHMPVYKSDVLHTCGSHGCIECYGCGAVLQGIWKKRYSDEALDDIFLLHGQEDWVADFVEALAVPVATEINILDPDVIFLSGSVISMKNFPYDVFLKKIFSKTHMKEEDRATVIYPQTDVEVGVIGSGLFGIKMLEEVRKI